MNLTRSCSCGAAFDPPSMPKVGWCADGEGNAFLLANCLTCGSSKAIDFKVDASICDGCHRLIVDEIKTCTQDGVFCSACGDHRIRERIEHERGAPRAHARACLNRERLEHERGAPRAHARACLNRERLEHERGAPRAHARACLNRERLEHERGAPRAHARACLNRERLEHERGAPRAHARACLNRERLELRPRP